MAKDLKRVKFNSEPNLIHGDIGQQGEHKPTDPDKEKKEGVKEIIGAETAGLTAVNPVVGGASAIVTGTIGTLTEGIGKITDNQGVKEIGEVMKDGPTQSIKDVKKVISKVM